MINTRFFDLKKGDRILIKNNINSLSRPFVTALVRDIQNNYQSPFLLFTDEYTFYPCPALKWNNADQRMLYWDLEPIKELADIFIVDRLGSKTDIANVVRLINETDTLNDKTIILFCDTPYLLSKADIFNSNNIPMNSYTQEEIKFNTYCKQQGATAIYDLFTYGRSWGSITYFWDSENRNSFMKLKLINRLKEFTIWEDS